MAKIEDVSGTLSEIEKIKSIVTNDLHAEDPINRLAQELWFDIGLSKLKIPTLEMKFGKQLETLSSRSDSSNQTDF